jgi:iron complex outermembrane receptor protein
MSELIQKNDNRATIRWKLLTSASALALMVSSISMACAEDADHPLIWIELGGQAENISGQGAPYAPGFLSAYSDSAILQEKATPLAAQKPPLFSLGEEASISFQPENSDWVFSAAVRFGRSGNRRDVHHQTDKVHYITYKYGKPVQKSGDNLLTQENFVDTKVNHDESHAIMDFMAGKDVGLGLFNGHGSSVLSAGVRIAQFTSHASVDIRARPDAHFFYLPSAAAPTHVVLPYFHTYHVSEQATRSFRGIGPSLSWTASAPVAGSEQNGEISLDWGANAALLFGRQKTTVHHQGYGRDWPLTFPGGLYSKAYLVYANQDTDGHSLNKSVTMPNVGGFAGLSFRYADAKLSLGYRADFFFNAIDGGIDTRKSETLGFKGPFASVSIGLGG